MGTALRVESGKITTLVEIAERIDTPLERGLQGLATKLMLITASFAAIFIIKGLLSGKEICLLVETVIAITTVTIHEATLVHVGWSIVPVFLIQLFKPVLRLLLITNHKSNHQNHSFIIDLALCSYPNK
jgi:hypothetical protein